MIFILLAALLGGTQAKGMLPQINYLAIQENSSWTGSWTKTILRNVTVDGTWPSYIHYMKELEKNSGIKIEVSFEDGKGRPNDEYESIPKSDICDILDRAIHNRTSPEAKFLIPQALGLYGTRCPIKAGLKSIAPYQFPTLIHMAEMGEGPRKMLMIVRNEKMHANKVIFELSVNMNVRYWPMKIAPNEFYQLTITESISSSSDIPISTISALFVSIVLALWLQN